MAPTPRSLSLRLGVFLVASAVIVASSACCLDVRYLPQRWSLSDEPLPGWFFGPLGHAWVYGMPLVVVALLAAGIAMMVRGRIR